jgi:hypothetical protein
MNALAIALGIVAGAMHVVAYLVYNKQMLRGESSPNAATWTMWSFISTLNAATYLFMSEDIVKAILPVASTVACLGTFTYSIIKGKLSRLDRIDSIALGLGIIAALAWFYYKSPTISNMLLQIPIAISFVPTWRGVIRNPKVERALPWIIWSSAYIVNITAVILRWKGQPQDLVYPINCLFLHGGVGLLTFRKSKPAK